MQSLFNPLSFAALVVATARTSAPSGALTVGSSGHYSTIQAAVNALDKSTTRPQSIFVQSGTYEEQVLIPALGGALIIFGDTMNTASYTDNVVNIAASHSLDDKHTDEETSTLRVETSNGFMMYNINVKNTRGRSGQALALSANRGNQGYYGCGFYGFQDTLFAAAGKQVYGRCYIEGTTDFIFGSHAKAWFDQCDIRVLKAGRGFITASGRDSNTDSYYVINHSTVAAAAHNDVKSGAYYLGRPWGDYARVAFQFTSMTNVINSAGWSQWSSSRTGTDHVTFAEYANSGEGAKGTRASFATTLSKAIDITDILGIDYKGYTTFVDTSYLS